MPPYYLVMGFGALVALVGILLFWHRGTEGQNTIRMFGFEFQLAGSALVIFVVGTLVFLAPLLLTDGLQRAQDAAADGSATPSPTASESRDEGAATPVSEPQKPASPSAPPQIRRPNRSNGYALTVVSVLAIRTHCSCDDIQIVVEFTAVDRVENICNGDEVEISQVRTPFADSMDIGILVKDCGGSPNYWSKDVTVTKNHLGTRQVQLDPGGGLYSISYVVEQERVP